MAVTPGTSPIPDRVTVRRALLSVFDKTGLVDFARALHERGVTLVSSGGTKRALDEAGLPSTEVSEVTGFPEIMGGRVKTLHPLIHGGLLGERNDPDHAAAMERHGIAGIDLLVVNLYPFEATLAAAADPRTIVENIDIGGPALIRAAAKNHAYVAVATDPDDYDGLLAALDADDNATSLELRQTLAARAFARTAAYDAAIAGWFAGQTGSRDSFSLAGQRQGDLRYGENPHQAAALYLTGEDRPGAATARQVQGKQLSYNNINDTDAAYELVGEFDPDERAAVAIIKHANPCGVAVGETLADAYRLALRCDPVSAFGGIVALNRTIDEDVAAAIVEVFTEVVIAPDATDAALDIFAAKKNLRLLLAGRLPGGDARWTVRTVAGGFLAQARDAHRVAATDVRVVTKRAPSEGELADLMFAWRVAKHVKSNAIVYAREGATAGIGAGQMSRLDSARIAARKAEEAAAAAGLPETLAAGSVCASDAFFPFADGLIAAVEAGATAVIQPGGSMRDEEVIAAADERDLAMVFTGIRHFRH